MRILLALSHSVEEYDQLRLLHSLGYEVASLGGYIDPAHPHDPKRPALPEVPCVPEVKAAVDELGTPDNLGAAQARIPEAVLEWLGDAGVIQYHHYLDRLYGQWDYLADWRRGGSGRRIVWRTVGQSVEHNERQAHYYRHDGLEIVRYSPKERNIPGFAGEDALIRFYKDPVEWDGWGGAEPVVINVTQHLQARDPYTNFRFYRAVVEQRPDEFVALPLGPGSEQIGGLGELDLEAMKAWLRRARCYLYTGTQPASYTLGLLEALMTGVPVVSIGPAWMDVFPYGPQLFEGHELARGWSDDPEQAYELLAALLRDEEQAREWSQLQRQAAVEQFGIEAVGEAWQAFYG
jgi:glycosyltransferase involved in cell wall biosynthesis